MKILVIQQKMIGDVLTTSILFEVLRAKYPDAELHYLINSHTLPVVENNPFIDEFVFFTKEIENSKTEFYKFLKRIKAEKYDTVIDVYGKLSSNLISYFTKAETKISIKKSYSSFLYNHTFKDSKTPKTNAGLAIENRLQLLQPLLGKIPQPIKPKIYLTNTEIEKTKAFLISNSIDLNKPLIMIGVLGSDLSKTYPFEYMASVLDYIIETYPDVQLLFNYIPKQLEDANAIYNLCKVETKKRIRLNVFGKSLRDFICITHFCDALIGNEGGAVNMAKALNTPTFTIFSPWIDKAAWSLFENGTTNISVHLKDFKPELYKNTTYKAIKKDYSNFYNYFKPEFLLDNLTVFLKNL
ncbi:glycosyltransferase family 9 protein [Lacinutrix sp. 5H-3-7-4]|uniref:glycosyltransferase family 9 protein n=1 Tax=Lacinutrix sp. (strain 5H-3-7-4) TaxID=983544 RepID=UPI00020A3AB5|nr:glycosyltransferase family 9 protein [Lacinutrix sp. 5H-3-7-4]AEH00070.1 glycosyl transferase family 9 [Lacinutrix sp. 5H-3-7-4]